MVGLPVPNFRKEDLMEETTETMKELTDTDSPTRSSAIEGSDSKTRARHKGINPSPKPVCVTQTAAIWQ